MERLSYILFGIIISVIGFYIGTRVHKKYKSDVLDPAVVGAIFIVIFLSIFKIDMSIYKQGGDLIEFFVGPATVVFAVPLYKNLDLLKKSWKSILIGIILGMTSGFMSIYVLSKAFKIDYTIMASMLPKTVTTAIGMPVSQEVGGIPGLTASFIIITAIFGNISSSFIIDKLKITDPIARGIGMGTSAHGMGTDKAMRMGEKEGAFASVAITVAGVLSIILVPLFLKIFTY